MTDKRKCVHCRNELVLNLFKVKKDGSFTKGCVNCLESKRQNKIQNYCEHNMEKCYCKICTDPIHITIRRIIIHSREGDKKNNRYDETNFIDYNFVKNLIDKSNNKCFYCDCELQYNNYSDNLGTIERLSNSIGHIKNNCVIACRTCNLAKISNSVERL